MAKVNKLTKQQIQAVRIELARRNFFRYCNLRLPKLYKTKEEKGYAPYLEELCNELQEFFETDKHDIFIINMPPRHCKSLTAQLFEQWVFGRDPRARFMSGSYNSDLSTIFAKSVRNAIGEEKLDARIVYSDIFPNTKLKKGDMAADLWSLDGSPVPSFLATSPSSSSTGIGCNWLVIDDIIKTYEEACNENALNKQYEWFSNTMLSRLEDGGKIIIVMTRWSDFDLAGKILENFSKDWRIKTFIRKALQEDGTMLNPEVLSYKDYKKKIAVMGQEVVSANYDQVPINIKGCLYQNLKTYSDVPRDKNGSSLIEEIKVYTDTADTGNDWLVQIIYGIFDMDAYVLDVYYTKDGMEITEPEAAKRLHKFDVTTSDVESNNGGRGYARNVENILRNKHRNYRCMITPFHQSKNKIARIISNSTVVMNHVYFPDDWKERFPEFHRDLTRYQRQGKNTHDDCADAITGVVEKMGAGSLFDFN